MAVRALVFFLSFAVDLMKNAQSAKRNFLIIDMLEPSFVHFKESCFDSCSLMMFGQILRECHAWPTTDPQHGSMQIEVCYAIEHISGFNSCSNFSAGNSNFANKRKKNVFRPNLIGKIDKITTSKYLSPLIGHFLCSNYSFIFRLHTVK